MEMVTIRTNFRRHAIAVFGGKKNAAMISRRYSLVYIMSSSMQSLSRYREYFKVLLLHDYV